MEQMWLFSAAAYWLLQTLWIVIGLLSLGRLPENARPADATIIIAARDEEARIEETLRRATAQAPTIVGEGPSRDSTPAIVDASAAQRVAVQDIPDGWVGKSWALHQAVQGVSTEWLVFLDADVWLAPGTVDQAIAWADQRGFDGAVLYPGQRCRTILGRAGHLVIGQGMLIPSPPWLVRRGRSAAGLGHCMVVRRRTYEAAGGHEAIRSAILDDVALGTAVGAQMVSATDHAESDWADSMPAIVQAMRKNAFAGLGYRWWLVLLMSAWYLSVVAGGAIGWMFGGWGPLATVAWAFTMLPSFLQQVARIGWGPASRAGRPENLVRRTLAVLLTPLAWSLYIVLPVWSMISTWRGIEWRGTRYVRKSMR